MRFHVEARGNPGLAFKVLESVCDWMVWDQTQETSTDDFSQSRVIE